MGFLYLLLIFVLFIVVAVLFAAGNIIRAIFGGFRGLFSPKNQQSSTTSQQSDGRTYTTAEKRGKVFGPNEGEYVDFEEIKEN